MNERSARIKMVLGVIVILLAVLIVKSQPTAALAVICGFTVFLVGIYDHLSSRLTRQERIGLALLISAIPADLLAAVDSVFPLASFPLSIFFLAGSIALAGIGCYLLIPGLIARLRKSGLHHKGRTK